MAPGLGLNSPRTEEIGINFPFVLVLQHPPVTLEQMFGISQSFDLYEMEPDTTDNEGLVKENILVDVLDMTPTTTTLKVTPADTMPYGRLALHTKTMLDRVAKRLFKGKAKVVRLTWQVDQTGIASDVRGMLRKVT